MPDRIPRRLRFSFGAPDTASGSDASSDPESPVTVDFRAYSADCILSGRSILDGDRLTDMLNDQDEYTLIGVTVERFDGGEDMTIEEIVVARDEIWLVDTGEPRGVDERRHRTAQQYVALKMGPFKVRGFFHGLPGTDPVTSIGRRKPMIPLTNVRIEYVMGGDEREALADVAIVNREKVEWLEAIEPDRAEFPEKPTRRTTVETPEPTADDAPTADDTAKVAADRP